MWTTLGTTAGSDSTYAVAAAHVHAMYGPALSGFMATLQSVSVWCGDTHTEQVRLAVFLGGMSSGTSPTGATLLEDLGQTTGSVTNGWVQRNSPLKPGFPGSAVLWIAVKADNTTGTFAMTYSATTDSWGDFSTDGQWTLSTEVAASDTAWSTAINSVTGPTTYWYNARLTYTVSTAPGVNVGTRIVQRFST